MVIFSGQGFATGTICLGELEVLQITKFESVWSCNSSKDKKKCATFYKPVDIPVGFFCLGHYSQSNDQPLHGFVLVAREVSEPKTGQNFHTVADSPALRKPLDYTLVYSTDDWRDENHDGCGYFWLPQPPEGYKSMGYVVSNSPGKPSLEEVKCVRDDLTVACETHDVIFDTDLKFPKFPFRVWNTRPCHRGMLEKGVSVGTFFCSSYWTSGEEVNIACLKNLDPTLHAMPNLDQICALIKHYGPTVFFHPDEIYLPSSVPWFFKNGAMLYKKGDLVGFPIDSQGSNLPNGGTNDGEYWIDLPNDDSRSIVKCGNLESAELYVHVKPALGGTFTDIVMWVFCPFNGPATIKIGLLNFALNKIGQHVGDWEHFTLRISNFTGELWSIYFSQHSGGEWVDACNLEFIEGNKAIVYSSKNGHASFPQPGNYLQGSLGIGVRNDTAKSNFYVDSSIKYQIVAAEYLGDSIVTEPCWLQYMREWGPTIVYDGRSELERIISHLPVFMRFSVENIFDKLPVELYGEEGPSGPKEKNNWFGDERS
ncbi:Vacuolar protein sorting-associated protein 62 [Macleaya cordata]|uniref:Vacuolar protein sorting-associated protein 62 n=1 Tax=Macleaya cordata TaxID=56857 RepID=A0A200PVW2_MACCD|nr:Vacuolar protein sorting-associated protein 62 [Macleaya cordata]